MNTRPKPFDGPQWEGWEVSQTRAVRGNLAVFPWKDKALVQHGDDDSWEINTLDAARQVALCIEAAQRGEQVGPVAELVEALEAFDKHEWHYNLSEDDAKLIETALAKNREYFPKDRPGEGEA